MTDRGPGQAVTGSRFQGQLTLKVNAATWSIQNRPPLQATVLSTGPGQWLAFPSDASGGLRGGDHQAYEIEVVDCALFWQPPAAMVVYKSAAGVEPEAWAELQTDLRLVGEAYAAFQARPIIPCRQTRLRQTTSIELSESAGLFFAEQWTAGRVASGEYHHYEQLSSGLRLRVGGRLVFQESWRLDPGLGRDGGAAGLGESRAWGLAIARGERGQAELHDHFLPNLPPDSAVAVGQIDDQTLLVRYRTATAFDIVLGHRQRRAPA